MSEEEIRLMEDLESAAINTRIKEDMYLFVSGTGINKLDTLTFYKRRSVGRIMNLEKNVSIYMVTRDSNNYCLSVWVWKNKKYFSLFSRK